jgi:hypothetical protein
MARYAGRAIIAKVDDKGNKIKGKLSAWIKKNPGRKYFDSYPEWEVWNYIVKHTKLKYEEQTTLELFASIDVQEFQAPRRTKKAIAEGRTTKEIKDCKQLAISYTPDFYLPKYDLYIEVKGYADELFKLRWKLFKLKGYKGYIVYSLKDFKNLMEELENKE